ncbi:MAG TPA: N-acetylneuraminate synthase family protein [Chitinophagaceae bacterium]|jgi:N-acetylneuraminate synthase|nr:N-acetylneuraminate synthase family protein [Chitinophagaceae bacterium]
MIIAEIAQAHDGSLGILHSYIDALASTGIDAVKFQTHIAEAESSIYEPFRVKFSYEDNTRYDYWKRMEFTAEQWAGIKKHCEEKGLEFLSSPFSNMAVDLLENIGVKRYKVGSGEITNHLLLHRIGLTQKPVILSSGMSTWDELDEAVNFFRFKQIDVSVLQCVSAYPSKPEQWGLNVIKQLKERYHIKTGYSDHSGDIYACLAAAALGAEIFEFHAVFDKRMFGPDAPASVTIDEIKKMTEGIKQVKTALQHAVTKSDNGMQAIKAIFEKSLALNQALKKGTVLQFHHLEAKKPKGYGVDAADYNSVIGKTLKADKQQWDFLQPGDIE